MYRYFVTGGNEFFGQISKRQGFQIVSSIHFDFYRMIKRRVRRSFSDPPLFMSEVSLILLCKILLTNVFLSSNKMDRIYNVLLPQLFVLFDRLLCSVLKQVIVLIFAYQFQTK